jgi:predicted membrane protein
VLAAVAFTSIAFGAVDVTSSLQDAPGWNESVAGIMRFESRAVTVTAVLTLVCYLVPALRERMFGMVERLLYVASIAWLLTTSIHLASLAGGG